MKKLFCALLILSLIFCPTALAANGTYSENDRTATTTLTTTINGPDAPTYTIIIPSTLSIAPNATSTELAVKLQEVASASAISVETNLSGSMTNGSDGTIDFTVSPNRLTFAGFNSLPSIQTMAINITEEEWQQAPAGTYAGTMTFTISAQ